MNSPEVIDTETGEVVGALNPNEDRERPRLVAAEQGSAMVVVEPRRHGLELSTVDQVDIMANRFAEAMLVPEQYRGKPADVFFALNYGLELGLSPAASLRAIHVIKGKPGLAADAMLAVVHSSGACERFSCIESSNTVATYETVRYGDPTPRRETFTIEDAERAGLLGKDVWKSYPKAMLKARAKAMLARDVYPDVVFGIYTPEELSSISSPVLGVLESLKSAVRAVKSKSELDKVGLQAMNDLTTEEQNTFRPIYKRRLDELRAEMAEREKSAGDV